MHALCRNCLLLAQLEQAAAAHVHCTLQNCEKGTYYMFNLFFSNSQDDESCFCFFSASTEKFFFFWPQQLNWINLFCIYAFSICVLRGEAQKCTSQNFNFLVCCCCFCCRLCWCCCQRETASFNRGIKCPILYNIIWVFSLQGHVESKEVRLPCKLGTK